MHDVRFHQHSRLQPCGDARGHGARESPIVLRRTPPRTPIRWLIHHVSRPRRRRADRLTASPSTSRPRQWTRPRARFRSTPIPRRRRPALPAAIRSRRSHPAARRSLGKGGRSQVARDEYRIEIDSPTPSVPASTSPRQFPIAAHQLRRRTDDNVFTERLHERHAYRRRREGVHTG